MKHHFQNCKKTNPCLRIGVRHGKVMFTASTIDFSFKIWGLCRLINHCRLTTKIVQCTFSIDFVVSSGPPVFKLWVPTQSWVANDFRVGRGDVHGSHGSRAWELGHQSLYWVAITFSRKNALKVCPQTCFPGKI